MHIPLRTTATRSRPLRWPWLAAAALLLSSAIATALATYVYWLPCRGNMTSGLFLSTAGPEFQIPDACLKQMDAGTPFPFTSDEALYPVSGPELTVVGMALSALAWLVLVIGLRWRRRTKAVAVVPALLSLGLALLSAQAVLFGGARRAAYPSFWWWLLLEGVTLGVLVVVALWEPGARGGQIVGLAVILWGVAAFGVVHEMIDYTFMTAINEWNWDCPPGCGYLTAVAVAVAALASAAVAASGRQHGVMTARR